MKTLKNIKSVGINKYSTSTPREVEASTSQSVSADTSTQQIASDAEVRETDHGNDQKQTPEDR